MCGRESGLLITASDGMLVALAAGFLSGLGTRHKRELEKSTMKQSTAAVFKVAPALGSRLSKEFYDVGNSIGN